LTRTISKSTMASRRSASRQLARKSSRNGRERYRVETMLICGPWRSKDLWRLALRQILQRGGHHPRRFPRGVNGTSVATGCRLERDCCCTSPIQRPPMITRGAHGSRQINHALGRQRGRRAAARLALRLPARWARLALLLPPQAKPGSQPLSGLPVTASSVPWNRASMTGGSRQRSSRKVRPTSSTRAPRQ
jgi:hypothetical protein